ncbi:MAG: hypothetical protein M1522_06750, partial [Actinobacteria bacterium]|nr:hypothetical protein [Actinomycetota bacterium]
HCAGGVRPSFSTGWVGWGRSPIVTPACRKEIGMQPSQYVTVAELLAAPLGLSLRDVTPGTALRAGQQGATQAMTYDELTALAQRSSVIADTFCEQVLGATVDSEEHWTGDGLAGIDNNGNVWVQTERWPVVEALSFQYGLPYAGGTTWTVASVSSVLIAGKAGQGVRWRRGVARNGIAHPGPMIRGESSKDGRWCVGVGGVC